MSANWGERSTPAIAESRMLGSRLVRGRLKDCPTRYNLAMSAVATLIWKPPPTTAPVAAAMVMLLVAHLPAYDANGALQSLPDLCGGFFEARIVDCLHRRHGVDRRNLNITVS